MTSRRSRWIVLGIAAVAVALLLLFALRGRGGAPDVSVARVTRQSVESWISTNGKVEPIHPHILRARLDTFVVSLGVVEGQKVKKGQLLAQLDATGIESKLAAAQQSLLAAQRELRYAKAGGSPEQRSQLQSELTKTQASRDRLAAEQKTLQALVKEHAATLNELQQNQLQLKQTEAELVYLEQKKHDLAQQARFNAGQAHLRIAQARAEISDLSEKISSSRLVAPVDGTVYSLPVKAGDFVQVGQPVVSVANLGRVRVLAYVDEADLGSVALDQAVHVQWDGLPGKVWSGRTTRVPKQVVPYHDRRVGEVRCSVSTSGGQLLPNTNVDVRIEVGHAKDALVVPRGAVQGDVSGQFLYLVKGGRLVKQPVQVGIASTTQFQILEGVTVGDRVALPGAANMRNGMRIHPLEVQ